jgi:hypothetical protein
MSQELINYAQISECSNEAEVILTNLILLASSPKRVDSIVKRPTHSFPRLKDLVLDLDFDLVYTLCQSGVGDSPSRFRVKYWEEII